MNPLSDSGAGDSSSGAWNTEAVDTTGTKKAQVRRL